MNSTYVHPPANPEVAGIVTQLAEGLQHIEQIIEESREYLDQGHTLGELRGITDEGYAALYKIAHELCDQGEFQHALPVALQLTLHQPTDSRYSFMTGACLQRLKQFDSAALMYALSLDVNPEHAAAAYRLAECLIAIGKPEEAKPFLHKAIDLSYGDFDKRTLMEMAQQKLDSLLH